MVLHKKIYWIWLFLIITFYVISTVFPILLLIFLHLSPCHYTWLSYFRNLCSTIYRVLWINWDVIKNFSSRALYIMYTISILTLQFLTCFPFWVLYTARFGTESSFAFLFNARSFSSSCIIYFLPHNILHPSNGVLTHCCGDITSDYLLKSVNIWPPVYSMNSPQ